MEYEIIATLGPSSAREQVWKEMLAAGTTAFRLNTSHLSLEKLHDWLERLERLFAALEARPPLVLDLQGSKWRLGQFAPQVLKDGQSIALVYARTTGGANRLPVPHADFFAAAPGSSGEIVLNDAKVRLRMDAAGADSLRARVIHGGHIFPGKGITFTGSTYRVETLNEKDQAIFEQTHSVSSIRYAISYVRDAAEMQRYRALLDAPAYLVAKLEREPAIAEAFQIAGHANELWLCRGDLGAELGMQDMAESVHRFSGQLSSSSTPVLLAGQVLEHMSEHSTPTRSEVCYLYDALLQGYTGFVLSDETAIGRYPVESCRSAALFKN